MDALSRTTATWSEQCVDFGYNCVLEQVGSRGGQEEVLEFSKRTAAQVKAILDQGQVFLRTMSLMLGVVFVMKEVSMI